MDKWRWDDIRWLHHQGDNHQEKDDESFDFSVGGLQVEQFSGQFKDEKKIIMWKCWNRRRCPTSLYLFTSWLVHLQVVKMWIVMIRVLLDCWFWCNPGSWFVIPLFLSLIWCFWGKWCDVMKVTLAVASLTCILQLAAPPPSLYSVILTSSRLRSPPSSPPAPARGLALADCLPGAKGWSINKKASKTV